jgi:hypothetical protein
MLVGPAHPMVCAVVLLGWTFSIVAAEPIPKAVPPAATAAPKVAKPIAAPIVAPIAAGDPVQLRADVEKQLKDLTLVAEKDMTATQRSLRDLWNQRLQLLDDWDKSIKGRASVENPNPSPEREASERKAELERKTAQLDALKKSPDSVLPDAFRIAPDKVDDASLLEMRDAIDAIKASLKEKSTQLEKLRLEPPARTLALAEFRTNRDKLHTQITEQPTRRVQAEAKVIKSATEDARRIAREEMINFKCESGLAAERLHITEGCLALEVRRAATCEVATQAAQANVALGTATLAVLTERYKRIADRQKADLNLAAKTEEKKAQATDDPLDKYKALRTADLLSLQASILEDEKASSSPTLVPEEQKGLADKAEADFASLKQVVAENKVGGLVSLRLNNDFRRISRERAIIVRNELAQSSAANTFYENALTEAELNYFNDARDDRYERDAFIQTLPKSRHAAADAMIDEIERKHKELLTKRKDQLSKLLSKAEETHSQVTRRLRILDEQYTFIRANIFWVRDSEPLGPATIGQFRKESGRLLAALIKLSKEPFDRMQWTPISIEFGLAVAGLVAFPLIIVQARKSLKAILA